MPNTSSLDTNIFIRLFSGDMPSQYKKVVELLSNEDQTFVIEDAAILEMAHVLEVCYGKERLDIARDINFLCSIENVSTDRKLFERIAKLYYEHPKLSSACSPMYFSIQSEQSGNQRNLLLSLL